MVVSGSQMVAARALLDWNQKDLAQHIGVCAGTLCAYENGLRIPKHRMATLMSAFKDEGISFVNDDGVGVILKTGHGIGD